jgi:hypothetical protein
MRSGSLGPFCARALTNRMGRPTRATTTRAAISHDVSIHVCLLPTVRGGAARALEIGTKGGRVDVRQMGGTGRMGGQGWPGWQGWLGQTVDVCLPPPLPTPPPACPVRYDQQMSVHDLIIVSAGPSGLSAAIAAGNAASTTGMLEQGVWSARSTASAADDYFRRPCPLRSAGCPCDAYDKPTRVAALLQEGRRFADLRIAFGRDGDVRDARAQTAGASNSDDDSVFAIETLSSRGVRRVRHARHVVLATMATTITRCCLACLADHPRPSYYNEPHASYRQRVAVSAGPIRRPSRPWRCTGPARM